MRPKKYTLINRKLDAKYLPKVLIALNNVKAELITWVKELGIREAHSKLNNEIIINGIAPVIKALYINVGLVHARLNFRGLKTELKQLPGLGYSEIWTAGILETLQKFLRDQILFRASETTKELLLRVVSEGIEKGWGVDQTVRALEDFPGLKYQAERIVRTEVNRAANIGVIEAGKTFNYEQTKTWISIKDMRVRGRKPEDHANHLSLHGQTVDFDSVFIDPRNGDILFQPGDPRAKAESTINCRCTMSLKAKRDSRGRLIPKRNISVIMPGQIRRFTQTITI